MTAKQIHEKLDTMLSNPKTKNFLNHLVRAYFPLDNVDKVWDKPKGDFKCVLTKQELVSVEEIMQGIQTDEFKHDFINNLKSIFDEKVYTENPIIKLIGDKKLGVNGTETTTYMSYSTVQEFYNWVITKSLNGDKHINWLLGSIRKTSFLERVETIQDSNVQKKVEKMKKIEVKGATFTLGEMDAFKKIRENLKYEDKN